jgi:hypothetical protein
MVEARPWCVPAWGEVAARSTEEVGGPRREGLWARAGGADAREGGGGGRMRDRLKVLIGFFSPLHTF